MLRLKHSTDGFGFRYGTIDFGGEAQARVDLMPPEGLWTGTMRLPDLRLPDPRWWVVFIDGEEISRVATEADAFDLLQRHAAAARTNRGELDR